MSACGARLLRNDYFKLACVEATHIIVHNLGCLLRRVEARSGQRGEARVRIDMWSATVRACSRESLSTNRRASGGERELIAVAHE